MKKHKAPQFELPLPGEPFALIGERDQAEPPKPAKHQAEQFDIASLKPAKLPQVAQYKLMKIQETPVPDPMLDEAAKAHDFFHCVIEKSAWFQPEQESFVVMFLNVRRRLTGWTLISIGTLDTIIIHPREVFRAAVLAGAGAIILAHNHPSGDPAPSEADIKVTRDLIRAGQLLKIDVLDHIISGAESPNRIKPYVSLRELGYFF